ALAFGRIVFSIPCIDLIRFINQEAGPKRGFPKIPWLSWQVPSVLFIVAPAPSGGIRAAFLWFLNRRTILDVMLISSCNLYPFVDESPFVEREYHEIYREIYGDPIYDTYEDDVYVIDCLQKKTVENPRRAKFVRKRIIEDFVQNHIDNMIRAKLGRSQFDLNSVQKNKYEEGFQSIYLATRTLLKIRGRIFLSRRDLMQLDIWNTSKYLDYLLIHQSRSRSQVRIPQNPLVELAGPKRGSITPWLSCLSLLLLHQADVAEAYRDRTRDPLILRIPGKLE
ncbi:hypothetical protein IGI04_026999, partial [Brassica rapa subsp. trilocularis]